MANFRYYPQQNKVKWVGGPPERMPKNMGKYDGIRCKEIIEARGPFVRIPCDQMMKFYRVYEAGIQIKSGTARCNAWNGHRIQTKQMFVAICDNTGKHLNGEKNICCRVCIENYNHYMNHNSKPSFEIVKDYYTYKPKKHKRQH